MILIYFLLNKLINRRQILITMKTKRIITSIIFIFYILFFILNNTYYCNAVSINPLENIDNNKIKSELENIYNTRSYCFVTGNLSTLKNKFDTSSKYGVWALEHEVKRVKYLKNWSYERAIKFTDVNSSIRVKKINIIKNNTYRLTLEETYNFKYIYSKDINPVVNSFGIGIRHTVDICNKNGQWKIGNDWYTDCFEDALSNYNGEICEIKTDGPILNIENYLKQFNINSTERYDRVKAVEYADKYCGAANGNGNNFKYNSKYKDFTGIGGDCTNFVSQVLGDKEGGNLKPDTTWYWSNSSGSRAWVNADSLKNYLIYSGKATIIQKGTFKELAIPKNNNKYATVHQLELGDLICYAKKNDMDHFAVISSSDSHGYPLVNSHTTDRYHVPWDLGWRNKNITFYLIHIK